MKINKLAVALAAATLVVGGCTQQPDSEAAKDEAGKGVLEQTLDSVKDGVQTTADQIGESASDAGTAISETASDAGTAISETASDAGAAVSEGVESAKQAASDSAEAIGNKVDALSENMGSASGTAEEALKQAPPADTAASALENPGSAALPHDAAKAQEALMEGKSAVDEAKQKAEAINELH